MVAYWRPPTLWHCRAGAESRRAGGEIIIDPGRHGWHISPSPEPFLRPYSSLLLRTVTMPPPRRNGIHWASPLLILCPWVAAGLFALGHHLYYRNLAGQISSTGYLDVAGHSISRQQLHISIGNAFAYLVRTLLSLATTTAYTQAFWYFVKQVRNNATFSELDCTYAILSNVLGLFHIKAWRTYSVLLLIAVTCWYSNRPPIR